VADALAFGQIGFAAAQPFLGALSIANVLHQSDEIIHGTIGAAHAPCSHDGVYHSTVLAHPTLVERISVDPA
jgi:hypothetical protein